VGSWRRPWRPVFAGCSGINVSCILHRNSPGGKIGPVTRPTLLSRRRPSVARRRPVKPSGLTTEIVIATALAEIDARGLAQFSVRNVARALRVYPTAIVWHVPTRSALLAGVVSLVLADVVPRGLSASWQDYLRQFFYRFRAALGRHPNVAPLISTQLVSNRGVDFEFVERILATLDHAGFTGANLINGYNTVIAGLVGFSSLEFAAIPADDVRGWQMEMRDRLRAAAPTRYPILAANVKLLENRAFILRWQSGDEVPLDASFAAFVDVVITGLERMVAPRPRRRPGKRS
jgi:TetR/AcrR family tetracycline transcriptional repressor